MVHHRNMSVTQLFFGMFAKIKCFWENLHHANNSLDTLKATKEVKLNAM